MNAVSSALEVSINVANANKSEEAPHCTCSRVLCEWDPSVTDNLDTVQPTGTAHLLQRTALGQM